METMEYMSQINESSLDSGKRRIRKLRDWLGKTHAQIQSKTDKAKSKKDPCDKKDLSNDIYDFNPANRRVAILIINDFAGTKHQRSFAEHDETNMKNLFKSLNFDVIVLKNKTKVCLSQDLQAISRQIKENCDCLACVISSHGGELPITSGSDTSTLPRHHVLSTDDRYLFRTDLILQQFNDDHCPNLQGKPRMFFIQACRSIYNDKDPEHNIDKGFSVDSTHEQVDNDVVPDNMKENVNDTHVVEFFDIPCYEDYLVMFTSSSEKYGYSQEHIGGWLMHCLHTVFDELLDTKYDDFLQILTRVCWKMARDLEISNYDELLNGTKSAAVIYHMLTKEIHLRTKHMRKTKL